MGYFFQADIAGIKQTVSQPIFWDSRGPPPWFDNRQFIAFILSLRLGSA